MHLKIKIGPAGEEREDFSVFLHKDVDPNDEMASAVVYLGALSECSARAGQLLDS